MIVASLFLLDEKVYSVLTFLDIRKDLNCSFLFFFSDEKTQQESDSDLEPQPIKVTEDSSDVETDNKTTQPENKTPEVDNKHASGDHEDSATATESADNTNTPEVEKANEEPEG